MSKDSDKIKILVLCTGNSCRSQMAEGLFRHFGGDKIDVKSAGLEPKGVNPIAIQVMKEVGIDISGHTSKHLNEYLNEDFDYVITVCDNAAANCPVFPSRPSSNKGRHPFDKLRMTPQGDKSEKDPNGSHAEPVEARLPIRLHWPFPDPANATGTEAVIMRVFKKVRDEIGEKVKGWVGIALK